MWSEPQERPKQPSGKRREANTKPVGDLIYIFQGRHKRETQGEGLRISWDDVDWDCGSSGAEATGEPWESREPNGKPWDRGKVLLGLPWSRGRRTVEQVRRGNRAGAEDWKAQGERLRESTGREKRNK